MSAQNKTVSRVGKRGAASSLVRIVDFGVEGVEKEP